MNTPARTTAHTTPTGLTVPQLEDVYDTLAQAIDEAGEGKAQLMLVKLALLNANALADPELFKQQVLSALKDL